VTHPVSNYRFPPEELAVWRACATASGQSLTQWLRLRANEYVLSDGTVRDGLGNFRGIDMPAAARNLKQSKETTK
jgi:hypothetical protein